MKANKQNQKHFHNFDFSDISDISADRWEVRGCSSSKVFYGPNM